MSLTKHQVLQALVDHLDVPRPSLALLALVSIAVSAGLIWRYHAFKHLHSPDINFLVAILLALNVWNLILAVAAPAIFDLSYVLRYADAHQSYSLVSTANSVLNHLYIYKDLRLIAIILVSTLLINILAIGGLRCIEYISFIAIDTRPEPPKRHKKSVSFDENLVTFNYKEEMTLDTEVPAPSTSRLSWTSPLIDSLTNRGARRYMGLLVLNLVLALMFLPKTIQLNSSAVLLELGPDTQLKADHIYFSLLVTFVIITFARLFRIFNNSVCSRVPCFPKVVSIISRFVWFYICAIVNFSLTTMVLCSDVFINCLDAIINDLGIIVAPSTPMEASPSSYPIQFITSILIEYLSHSSLAPPETAYTTCSQAACDQTNMLVSLANSYNNMNVIIINCWILLNMLCFSLLPVLMWLIIDIKLCSLLRKSSLLV
ncbi:uncharacterized protein CANTADRAFT_21720 [Suhomyces tanzawaensis NRRL Y-17324]|uniref:Uncharacterized protein n=1 Tax=Suhomyces tanzawaensis NRRL Y-17324 TaxID=984487 RepID=A0A1E4SHG7_9ASCO|nr:uncharacterized protein CANTADRAFT_21720 [Suhomyces tanzawaensis NRRL Y-17324]ODV78936.1 hypothetical protein CANTADRAFT_21720 [Suhomyces tanzawaensis NRRL Y-17324]